MRTVPRRGASHPTATGGSQARVEGSDAVDLQDGLGGLGGQDEQDGLGGQYEQDGQDL